MSSELLHKFCNRRDFYEILAVAKKTSVPRASSVLWLDEILHDCDWLAIRQVRKQLVFNYAESS